MTDQNKKRETAGNQPGDIQAGATFDGQLDPLMAELELAEESGTMREQLDEAEKKHLLAVAELENFRKRSRVATQEQIRYASLPLMSEMLEALDNLQRAIDTAEGEASHSGLLEGVNMVASQILSILENHGCKKIEAIGKPFDPNLHQAVQMQPSDTYPANTVMMELRPGYQLHDRVIRPSQVFVSTGIESGE
ncbi:MAG: nucleotide exchange factor GrpE [Mariniblastus sp.]|nr:nucleotide exchange factor GrpE [Mariniblastus sp.]